MPLRADLQILIVLTERPMTYEELVFELDFRPSSVYGALHLLACSGDIESKREGKGNVLTHTITSYGLEKVQALSAPTRRRAARSNQAAVLACIRAGHTTVSAIVSRSRIARPQVYSALAILVRQKKITRTDPAGSGGRGGQIRAEYSECR